MSRKIPYVRLLFVPFALFTACIRDEIAPCPALSVSITVKDKNYFNVDATELEPRLDENQFFGSYVNSLCYTLRDAATGQIVEERSLFTPEGTFTDYEAAFCPSIPHGTYILTVWGGMQDEYYVGEGRRMTTLHPEGAEGDDVYLTHDTLVYDAEHTRHRVELERTKGKLIVQVRNLPAGCEALAYNVGNLWTQVSEQFEYELPGSISSVVSCEADAAETVAGLQLAPTADGMESVLQIGFPTRSTASPRQVPVTIRRNELTALRYDFDPQEGTFEIYLLVDGTWTKIHSLDIE